MEFTDPLGLLTPVDVAKFCAEHGLPRPVEVAPRGGRGHCVAYDLTFADAESKGLWVELVPGARGSGLAREAAALKLFGPSVLPIEVGPVAGFGRVAAIRPATNGTLGLEWVAARPDDWPRGAERIGATLSALHGTPMPGFGLELGDSGFRATHETWREEWLGYVSLLRDRAIETGVDMGPHTRRLVEAIEGAAGALDDVDEWTLVHGNLGPQSLEVGDALSVIGWEDACAGDPLVDVAALLALAPSSLGSVIARVPELARTWLQSSALRRVEVYHWTWCLAQLCSIGDYFGFDKRVARLANLGRLRAHARQALEPDFCRRRIEAALEAGSGSWAPMPVDLAEAQLYQGLGRLACEPLQTGDAVRLAAGLAATVAALDLDAEDPARTGCLIVAGQAFGDDRATGLVEPGPIEDVEAWRREVSALIEEARPEDATPLALWWIGRSAIAAVEGDVSDRTRRGLERLVRLALAERSRKAPPGLQLVSAVVGLGAIWGLREIEGDPSAFDAMLDPWRERLRAAGTALGAPTVHVAWDRNEVDAALGWRAADPGQRVVRPLLVRALVAMHGHEALPGGPRWVIRHAKP